MPSKTTPTPGTAPYIFYTERFRERLRAHGLAGKWAEFSRPKAMAVPPPLPKPERKPFIAKPSPKPLRKTAPKK
jgi:hypothetical protein